MKKIEMLIKIDRNFYIYNPQLNNWAKYLAKYWALKWVLIRFIEIVQIFY